MRIEKIVRKEVTTGQFNDIVKGYLYDRDFIRYMKMDYARISGRDVKKVRRYLTLYKFKVI